MKMKSLIFAGLAFTTSLAALKADDIFTFAGFTFDQRNTPNQAIRLGNSAVLGGATFGTGLPDTNPTGDITQFPGGTGFDTSLSLGRLTGVAVSGTKAINLPRGNDGTTTRHGVEVSWTGGRTLSNLLGADFVIYESASTINGVEGLMARAHTSAAWTDWFYFPADTFQGTQGSEGIHSYGFDLSDLGVSLNTTIDAIQLANLIDSDRIAGVGSIQGGSFVGEGQVLFGSASLVRPDAGTNDTDHVFSTSQLDPDPLYVAALHDLFIPAPVPEPSSALWLLGAVTGFALWRRKNRG